jgi:cob(I)alamin adenosyltransferase
MLEKGYTQLYTGNGKGKTTAALGLALRAYGAGLKTIIIQFMKGQHYSELKSISKIKSGIAVEQYGSPNFCMINSNTFEEHCVLAKNAMKRSYEVIADSEHDIVILDEIVTALHFKIVTMDEVTSLIKKKPEKKELILTGRGATPYLISLCDLVTEMTEIKHYYNNGIIARTGIEK